MTASLSAIIATELRKPVATAVLDCLADLRQRWPGTTGVLAYGSVLRGDAVSDTLIDYYVIVRDRADLSSSRSARIFGHVLPPNVYYGECLLPGGVQRYKCAVVTEVDFAAWMSSSTANPYFWARFAQPCRLIWTRDDRAQSAILSALTQAAVTSYGNAVALAPQHSPAAQWQALFRSTYGTELRPESAGRADGLVNANNAHFAALAAAQPEVHPIAAHWAARRWQGKLLSVLRLIKASFTFRGGVDYAAWKIERHSGVKIEITAWHRRHPLLAAVLLWRHLRRNKAIS